MKHKTQVWAWIGAIIVVAVVAFFIGRATMPSGYTSGVEVPGFPAELLLDAPQTMSTSYVVGYPSNTNQFTAAWDSSSSIEGIFADYVGYFQANGWTLNALPIKDLNVRTLSASSASGYALLTAIAKGDGSQVVVTYVSQ